MRRTHQASAIGVFHYKRLCVGLYDVNDLGERAAAILDREVVQDADHERHVKGSIVKGEC